jgi:hypothetical protein
VREREQVMSVTVTVELGELDIITTQDDREAAIKEARETIAEEYGFDFSRTCTYTIEGDGE